MTDSTTGGRRGGGRTSGAPVRPRAGLLERSVHRLYVHVAWTTLQRMPLLGRRSRRAVELQLTELCRRLGADPVAVRARRDRVHLVVRIRPSQDVGRLVTRLKRGSEGRLADDGVPAVWGGGYAASTVGREGLPRVLRRLGRSGGSSHAGRPPPGGNDGG